MHKTSYKPRKLFTVEAANKMLPLVRAIVQDIVTLSRDVLERRQRLAHLTEGRELQPGDPYGDELAETERELEKDTARLQGYLDELHELGVEFKGPDGLVDFPSKQDGRLVFLCWKLGEPEILHWHDVEAGFAGRQPLTADSLSGPGDLQDESLRE